MAITAEQTAAILAELSVDLATVTDDRLIELCLLYRSAPSVLPTFTDALATEITRRFTAVEIAANDVMFSVIKNFSNTFNPLANYQSRMYELSTVDVGLRDDWFRDNATFFYDLLHNAEALAWLVEQTEIVAYIFASTVAFDAVFGSSVATTAFVNSQIAMTAVAASSTAMNAVAASSVALSVIVKSTSARNALMSSNTILQSVKQQIYNTVTSNWSKSAFANYGGTNITSNSVDVLINEATAPIASPNGFVFAKLGFSANNNDKFYGGYVQHQNGVEAVRITNRTSKVTAITPLDVISFNGAKVYSLGYLSSFVELWIPPTT